MLIYIKYNLEENEIKYDSFEEIDNYDKVVYINFYYDRLTSLPTLPNSLQKFYCWNNQLTSLPELPNSLQHLFCGNNQLTSLPELPNLLKYFYHNENKFIKIIKYKYLKTMIYM